MGDVRRMIIELSVLDEGDLDSYAQIKQETHLALSLG